MWMIAMGSPSGLAQTVAQSESSIAYLKDRACLRPDGSGGWRYSGLGPRACTADSECIVGSCQHRSLVEPASDLYPRLEFPPEPRAGGNGEGLARYVPLCDDGSGDHEWSVSGGALGTPPTCDRADYIRCGDGGRPLMWVDASRTGGDDWLVYAGGGGHESSPYDFDPIWSYANALEASSYSAPSAVVHHDLTGVFDGAAVNPFSSYHRVVLDKCTADAWSGNHTFDGLQDFLVEQEVASVNGACRDANRDGTADCEDNQVDPNACACWTRDVAPPPTADHSYSVTYDGRRIVRATVADLVRGQAGYATYPLVDDGTGDAALRPGDEALPPLEPTSQVVFFCHSMGCSAMQGGLLDDLHALLDDWAGQDMDVRGMLNSFGNPAIEAEACVSDFDGVDGPPADGLADHPPTTDDTCSVYDGFVDATAVTGQPISLATFEPGGMVREGVVDNWEARPGYGPQVDASCLAHHCPAAVDWRTDPDCSPCFDTQHVLMNHLQTPFLYNEAQQDMVQVHGISPYCVFDGTTEWTPCDHDGDLSGVDLASTHWRGVVRKQFADLYRYAELERCEGGVGREWPYDDVVLMLPDRSSHDSLDAPATAAYPLDWAGPVPPTAMASAAWVWATSPGPTRGLCLEEGVPGENASQFTAGGVPTCQ